ncbi:olfactory receptor 1-like [Bufo gargarizans]|uniref:olfactory receptor 1-like n=1 Tax=Bufo gargarizans TaxID=30331 RepID=UPI001CF52480|nr:olfactory receptor 1-like [Bufo gargarizans]
MDNNWTSIKHFQIVAFSNNTDKSDIFFLIFFSIYMSGLLGNLIIISTVIIDVHLHTPMYMFLCNLSVVDIIFTSSTLPKLMDILLTRNFSISFTQCFAQLYFFMFAAGTEDILLSLMAYDRYVAVCKPLHYHLIMNKKKCILLLLGTWICGSANSVFMTVSIYHLDLCRSDKIQHFFCDIKALEKISCNNTSLHIILYVETMLLALCPFLLSITSYIKIIRSILVIKSTNSRKKTFSTCTSHLTVLIIFYGTGLCMYMNPPSDHLEVQDVVYSVLYTAVTPMLNPIIYSLRNKEVKGAMSKIISNKKMTLFY